MRKTYLTLEGQMLVPVTVRSKLIITMDADDVSTVDAVKMFLQGNNDVWANVEVDETEILAIGAATVDGNGEFDPGEVEIEQHFGAHKFTTTLLRVEDSK